MRSRGDISKTLMHWEASLSNDFSRSHCDNFLLVLRNLPHLPFYIDCLLPATVRHPAQYEEQVRNIDCMPNCLHWDSDTSVLTGFKGWILWPSPEQFVVGIQVVAFIPPSASTIQPSIHWFECTCASLHKAIEHIRPVPPYVSHAYWSRWQHWTSYSHLLGCCSRKGTTPRYCHLKANPLCSTVTRVHNSHRPSRWYSIPLQPLVPMQRRLHSSKTSPL